MPPKLTTRFAAVLALATAGYSTAIAIAETDLDPLFGHAEPLFHALGAWLVFAAASVAWHPGRQAASWGAGYAFAGAILLVVTTANLGAWPLILGHGITASLLLPALQDALRRRDTQILLDMRARPLRWVALFIALVAALAAQVSGTLYAGFEPETVWGPWAYVFFSWLTSALAATAWLPRPWNRRGLILGGIASAGWFVVMLPYEFVLNIGGHLLAAVFFFAAAWDERRPARPTRSTLSGSSSPRS